ncbi:hypothetical protein OSB04_012654 [Centaurea solstitialis]|uniref:PGG domain-containing protein n=1 Tax=Centaurea solstitialis TaxID=347529 RepID=A0AA38TNH2_9ASTR|nr:hypothetical protein OSB04_012654 [Centaurea solstitialis]
MLLKLICKKVSEIGTAGETKQVGDIQKEVGHIQNQVGKILKEVDHILNQVGAIQKEVGHIQNQVGDTQKEVGHIQNQVGDTQKEVGHIQNQVDDIQKEVGHIQNQVGHVQKEVGHVQKEVGHIQNQVGDVQKEVGHIQNQVGDVQKEVGHIQNQVGHIKREVGHIQNQVSDIKREVGHIQNQVGDIQKEVGPIQNQVGGDIHEHYYEAIALALENDNHEAIEEIIRTFPQATLTIHNGYHVTQFAIVNRCAKVYHFLAYDVLMTDRHIHKKMVDNDGNTLLHLAGLSAPIDKLNQVSGAALQMQRELQWFEEVKTFVFKKHRKRMNNNDENPMMVFRREHKDLREEGEAWMRKTANSYTITATLIITIVFAAAITVPGGNNGNTGKAIFANESSFIIFAVSDAMSLFASTTSLLLFLSILTARYRDEDFLCSLPKRLILGLAMLFLSVTSMMVAFSATLYIVFGQERKWILIPISTLTCLPIASFVTLQLPLLFDLFTSTYGERIFGKERNRKWIK